MTKYARDEFDRVPQNSSRQGVHRAITETPRPSLAPIMAVGALALVIGVVCFLILPKLGFAPAATSSDVSAQGSAESSLAPEAPSETPLADTEASPSAEGTPSPTETSSTPTPTAAAVDKTAVVSVYNGTTTGGLAARVAGQVQADGWALGDVDNWSGTPQQASVIFYNGASQLANAEALGALLGIANLVDSAAFQQPVVVVLGPGFQ